jgi:rubrerythrin
MTTESPTTCWAAVRSSDLLARREELLAKYEAAHKELKALETEMGFGDTQHEDHFDGTNCEEWSCKKCGHKWVSPSRWPCPKCHPIQRANDQAERQEERRQ